jgi:hypothetical protein
MNNYNDFLKIIQNKYENNSLNADSIYDELIKKENSVLKTINRVIDYEKLKENNKLFSNLSISKIYTNTFKILNKILNDLTKTNDLTINKFKKIITKDKRSIYIGILLIFIGVYLALIEISDSI